MEVSSDMLYIAKWKNIKTSLLQHAKTSQLLD